MLNTVALAGTVVNAEAKGQSGKVWIVRIAGTKWKGKDQPEEPCEISFTTFSNRAASLRGGEYVIVQGVVDGREYNGKHYIEIVARDMEIVGAVGSAPQTPRKPAAKPLPPAEDWGGEGDIPFLWLLATMVLTCGSLMA